MGGPEGVLALERVEHEMGEVLGPEGATSEELEPGKAFVLEPEADMSGEHSSDNESEPELDQGGQSGAPSGGTVRLTKTVRLVYRRPSTHRAELHEKADALGGRQSYATGAGHDPRGTSIICHRSQPRSAKHRRPRNGQIGSARGKAKWTGNSRARLA